MGIEAVLEKVPFSTSFESSRSPETYVNSINELVDTIIEKLIGKSDLPIKIETAEQNTIKKYFRKKLLPKPPTKIDKSIINAIEGIELVTEDIRRSQIFENVVKDFYNNNNIINKFR